MDMFGPFDGSRDLDRERILICDKLLELDPRRAVDYALESRTLKNKLLIQEGLKLVDSSRIHVDVGAIFRKVERTFAESFSRYRALVEAGIGVAQDLDTLLRASVKARDANLEHFTMPENEADTILTDIVFRLRDEFLSNADHGLNFYLSKRIRHGTIAGYPHSMSMRANRAAGPKVSAASKFYAIWIGLEFQYQQSWSLLTKHFPEKGARLDWMHLRASWPRLIRVLLQA